MVGRRQRRRVGGGEVEEEVLLREVGEVVSAYPLLCLQIGDELAESADLKAEAQVV